jgi:molybdopterin synthase sulfur carrier subunit
MSKAVQIKIRYFAVFREERGLSEEFLETTAETVGELYDDLRAACHFRLDPQWVRAAVNGAYVSHDHPLASGDEVVLIPPVAGG